MRALRVSSMLLGALLVGSASADTPCLQSGSGAVTVTGTLIQKVVPGPPNYQSVKHGDAPQVRWLIRLEATICVAGAAGEEPPADVSGVRVIQLLLPADTIRKDSALVGQRVTATGFVSTRQTGEQQAVVLLDVKTLEAAP